MEDVEDPDLEAVFDKREEYADVLGRSAATEIASWSVREAAHQAQSDGAPSVARRVVLKEWITGENPRPSHAQMDGERVPIDANFSNGQFWRARIMVIQTNRVGVTAPRKSSSSKERNYEL